MKKFLAIIAALMFLFTGACSTDKPLEGESVSVKIETDSDTPGEVKSWNIPTLPEGFPAPPQNMSMLMHSVSKGENIFFPSDVEVTEISFNCRKNDFVLFSNALKAAGYKGGFIHVRDAKTYYDNGFHGFWQNGKTAVVIANTIEIDKTTYAFTFYVADCAVYFPSGLKGIIPEFKGYTINTGTYNYLDSNGELQYTDLPKELSSSEWNITNSTVDYNPYIGVTLDEFDRYCETLKINGFEGDYYIDNFDGSGVRIFECSKSVDGKTYYVSMVFNSSAGFLDVLFSNITEY